MPYESGNELMTESYPRETENKLRYRIRILEEELKEEREDYKPKNTPSLDYYKDIRRIDRHCRMLDKKIKACRDDDKLIRLINCLGFIQGKKKEYTDQVLEIRRLLKESK